MRLGRPNVALILTQDERVRLESLPNSRTNSCAAGRTGASHSSRRLVPDAIDSLGF